MKYRRLFAGLLLCSASVSHADPVTPISFGRFGIVSVYRGSSEPRDVVLFLSGAAGWNQDMGSMAQRLVDKGAIVAGIGHYLEQLETSVDECVSPEADFENLSRLLQSEFGLKSYLQPTLVGYASGATLAYATLAEAPDRVFKGALSIDFCPVLDLKKPLCKGSGIEATPRRSASGSVKGVDFLPAKTVPGKWIALQATPHQTCPAAAMKKFIAAVSGAERIMPRTGRDYSVEENWMSQFEAAYDRIIAASQVKGPASASPVADLPLTIVPSANKTGPWFAIFLSGDGGWVGFDRGVSAELAKHNIPVVGWNSLKYFWSPRTPAGAADEDLDRAVRQYSAQWGKTHVLLIGYSQGADTMPFMVNRLPPASREMVGLTALLGLSDSAVFEFHVSSWLGNAAGGVPTAPELQGWSGAPYLCLYGVQDKDAACDKLTGEGGVAVKMSGGHHFGGSYAQVAREILSRLPNL